MKKKENNTTGSLSPLEWALPKKAQGTSKNSNKMETKASLLTISVVTSGSRAPSLKKILQQKLECNI
jgi:hypothetical protein